tara:strand:+ start:128 stop:577 length:450 start_codon:yes stop_codon:yes gene_type:complete
METVEIVNNLTDVVKEIPDIVNKTPNTWKIYLQKFILGSSYFMILPYYIFADYLPNKKYTMKLYVVTAPIYLGTWNLISYIIANKFNLSKRIRFIIGMIGAYFCIVAFGMIHNIYKYKSNEWKNYMKKLSIHYIIMWNIVLYNIESIFE